MGAATEEHAVIHIAIVGMSFVKVQSGRQVALATVAEVMAGRWSAALAMKRMAQAHGVSPDAFMLHCLDGVLGMSELAAIDGEVRS